MDSEPGCESGTRMEWVPDQEILDNFESFCWPFISHGLKNEKKNIHPNDAPTKKHKIGGLNPQKNRNL